MEIVATIIKFLSNLWKADGRIVLEWDKVLPSLTCLCDYANIYRLC